MANLSFLWCLSVNGIVQWFSLFVFSFAPWQSCGSVLVTRHILQSRESLCHPRDASQPFSCRKGGIKLRVRVGA